MTRTPYNFCDYRCDHCLETERCDVYKRLEKESLLVGDDAPSLLASLQASFRETEDMIKQKAREFGIDIDQIAGGASSEEIQEQRKSTMLDELYQQAHAFSTETSAFIRDAQPLVPDEEREYVDDIAWHHTVVSAKVYRALGWKTDGEIAADARDSAAVAMKSLTICIISFGELAASIPQLAARSRVLAAAGSRLKENIKKRFRP